MKKKIKTKCELDWFVAKDYLESLSRLGGIMNDEEFVTKLKDIEKHVENKAFSLINGEILNFYAIVEHEKIKN
ncbi:MAG: hypothetical protein FWE22_04235 [Firmicutes bacterium]|nr:hypothetical protein [Bacillota bacterium]